MPNIDAGLKHLTKNDPVLKNLIIKIGHFEPIYLPLSIESLFKIILSQSLSKEAAEKIFLRFKILIDNDYSISNIFSLDNSSFRKIGLSNQKINTIKETAQVLSHDDLDFQKLISLNDDEIMRILTKINGIGFWTVQMFLIFCLKRLDILPINDIWLLNSIKNQYRLRKLPTTEKLAQLSEKWAPYRTIASWYLWKAHYSEAKL